MDYDFPYAPPHGPAPTCAVRFVQGVYDYLNRTGFPVEYPVVRVTVSEHPSHEFLGPFDALTVWRHPNGGWGWPAPGAQQVVWFAPAVVRNLCLVLRTPTRGPRRPVYSSEIPLDSVRVVFHEAGHRYSGDEGLVEAWARDEAAVWLRRTYKIRTGGYRGYTFAYERQTADVRKASARITGKPWPSAAARFLRRWWLLHGR